MKIELDGEWGYFSSKKEIEEYIKNEYLWLDWFVDTSNDIIKINWKNPGYYYIYNSREEDQKNHEKFLEQYKKPYKAIFNRVIKAVHIIDRAKELNNALNLIEKECCKLLENL